MTTLASEEQEEPPPLGRPSICSFVSVFGDRCLRLAEKATHRCVEHLHIYVVGHEEQVHSFHRSLDRAIMTAEMLDMSVFRTSMGTHYILDRVPVPFSPRTHATSGSPPTLNLWRKRR